MAAPLVQLKGWMGRLDPSSSRYFAVFAARLTDPTFPKPEPEKEGTKNLPGRVNQPDIELKTVASPDKECNLNGARVSLILSTLIDVLCSQF